MSGRLLAIAGGVMSRSGGVFVRVPLVRTQGMNDQTYE